MVIDTSGLTDNWDDAEGRYCKCLTNYQSIPLQSITQMLC
jgi:hypothetical protein